MYRVIIVEDDPMVADIDQRYVEMDRAFRVMRLCKNGAEGLRYVQEHPVDLVILDYYTPGMNGTEFVDRLHTMGKTPAVIMVTSASETNIIQGLLSRGVLDYLVKPFQYTRFQQALGRFCQYRQRLEQKPDTMDQQAIDQLLPQSEAVRQAVAPLSKGLNAGTLDTVRRFFARNPECSFTCEEISEQLGLSRITIRRYVNYLADEGEVVSTIDYQTGGRPAVRYTVAQGTTRLVEDLQNNPLL